MEFTPCQVEFQAYRDSPKLASIQDRDPDIGIVPQELETLQLALEDLICSAIRRQALILSNQKALNNGEQLIFTPPPSVQSVNTFMSFGSDDSCSLPETPFIKTKLPEQDSIVVSRTKNGSGTGGAIAGKCSPKKDDSSAPITSPVEALTAARSEIPIQFWKFVDEYCRPLTPDDVNNSIIPICTAYQNCEHFFEVPDLGSDSDHATQNGTSANTSDKAMTNGTNSTPPPSSPKRRKLMRWRANDKQTTVPTAASKSGTCDIGPMTERLVSSLIEDNLTLKPTQYLQSSECDDKLDVDLSVCGLKGRAATRFENNLRNELFQLGFLDGDPETKIWSNCEDEILCELKCRQRELDRVMEVNKARLGNLHHSCVDAINTQTLQRRADLLDKEVMDNYQRVVSARTNKKPLTKREHDTITKTLAEWKSLYKKLGVTK